MKNQKMDFEVFGFKNLGNMVLKPNFTAMMFYSRYTFIHTCVVLPH